MASINDKAVYCDEGRMISPYAGSFPIMLPDCDARVLE